MTERVNMRAQAPDRVKDDNGDAWGTIHDEEDVVSLDGGGTMVHTDKGWEYVESVQIPACPPRPKRKA